MKICKFCEENIEKYIDCHIIPKAFFVFSQKMSAKIGWSGNMLMITNTKGEQPKKRVRIGWYDPQLVCEKCERRFGKYDDYAIQLLLKNESKHKSVIENSRIIAWVIENFDFKLLKLFFISILWRSSASSLPQFNKISLNHDLQRAKELILSDDEGKEEEFSFLLARFGDAEGMSFMLDPHKESKGDLFGDLNCYRFYLGAGYVAYIKVDKRPFPPNSRVIAAKREKPLYILRRSDFRVSKEMEVYEEVSKNSKNAMKKIRLKAKQNTA